MVSGWPILVRACSSGALDKKAAFPHLLATLVLIIGTHSESVRTPNNLLSLRPKKPDFETAGRASTSWCEFTELLLSTGLPGTGAESSIRL